MTEVTPEHKRHILKIWARARANAFAHRAATSHYVGLANVMFIAQFILGLLSFFLVVVLYALISREPWISSGLTPLLLTLWSLFYSMLAMGVSVLQNYVRFEERAAQHNHNHHSFLYLAQRSREIDSPGKNLDFAQTLIDDLERDFQTLKVRGQEPSDRDYRVGHSYLQGISESQFANLQTASLGDIDQTATTGSSPQNSNTALLYTVRNNNVSFFERNAGKFVGAITAISIIGLIISTLLSSFFAYKNDSNLDPRNENSTKHAQHDTQPSMVHGAGFALAVFSSALASQDAQAQPIEKARI